jgi:hypothetical protein
MPPSQNSNEDDDESNGSEERQEGEAEEEEEEEGRVEGTLNHRSRKRILSTLVLPSVSRTNLCGSLS